MSACSPIHGFIGSSLIGVDPFSPRSWSGISRFFFNECKRQGILHGADGGEVAGLTKWLLLARSFHPNREIWRLRHYLSPTYRRALTRVLAPSVSSLPEGVDALQFGALFDIPSLLRRGQRCFSYHDGNMAQRIANPFASTAVPPALAKTAMAYEKSVYDGLDRIFTMSEYLRRSFIDDFDQPPEKVVCIGAGVNLENLPAENPEKRYDTGEILFIGADFNRKGGCNLLRAFSEVRQKHPKATLHVVGPRSGPPTDLPLGGVIWHGHLSKNIPAEIQKLESLFLSSSVFVLPSLYEPFGIAPAEAMVYGIPAVVSQAWALQETVKHGQTGIHIPPGNDPALASAISQLLDQPDELRRLGHLARQDALERFTWPSVIHRMRDAIQEISGDGQVSGRTSEPISPLP